MIKLSKIKSNPNNPRLIKDDKFKKLCNSISALPKMMELRPIVVDENYIVQGGNMRLKALNELGYKEIPDTWVKMAADFSEDELKEFIIKDNVGFGEWDWDDLANNWDAEQLTDWGLDIPNFDAQVLEAEEDDFEILNDIKTDIVLGDLFEIGEHRLLCGDSIEPDAVAKLMNGKNAEMLFTSPPYSDMREYNGKKNLLVSNLSEFIPTWMPFVEYQVVNLGIQRKDNNINEYWNEYINKARDNGYKFLSWNVWAKPSAGSIGNQSAFFPIAHEWIFVFGKKFKDINRTCERTTLIKKDRTHRKVRQADGSMKISSVGLQGDLKEMESVFYSNPELGDIRSLHPATFPIELPSEYIKAMSNENDIIAEPFTGSGTTMVAAHQLNRKCYGMELDEKYCQVIVDRMLKLDSTLVVKRNGLPYEKTEQ
jgi:DNA modification methylase